MSSTPLKGKDTTTAAVTTQPSKDAGSSSKTKPTRVKKTVLGEKYYEYALNTVKMSRVIEEAKNDA